MKSRPYVRFAILSTGIALMMSVISLLFLNRLLHESGSKHRDRFLIFLAQSIEAKIDGHAVDEFSKIENPLQPHDWKTAGPHPPPPPPHTPELWLVDEQGRVVLTNGSLNLPQSWDSLTKPKVSHEISESSDYFHLFPSTTAIQLDHQPTLYLISRDAHRPSLIAPMATQALIMFIIISTAFVLSLFLLFLYLRRKSDEARAVLKRLGQGDLKARFAIQTFDEFSGLLVDFNQMADQIERLVFQVREQELKRRNLVQELGHDLRTPLTSLATSFDTLEKHHDRLSTPQRQELSHMIRAEILYFGQLIENLMTISDVDKLHLTGDTQRVNMGDLLRAEVQSRQSGSSALKWSVQGPSSTANVFVDGDRHLLQRLIRNGLDNAGRFAKSQVEILWSESEDYLEIQIQDDGPGLDAQGLEKFGTRQTFRSRRVREGLNFSLGLGSVIMKSIVEVHAGQIQIANRTNGLEILGACLTIRFAKSRVDTNPATP